MDVPIKFDNYMDRERLDAIKKSLWTLVAKIGVPLYIIYLPFDFYYIPQHKWICVALRLAAIIFLPWAYFLSKRAQDLFKLQVHLLIITGLFLGLLSGIIYLANDVKYLYFIGLHMGCVAAMVLIPWQKRFILWVPFVVYVPYLFTAYSLVKTADEINFLVASLANGLGLVILLYIVWQYNERLRLREINARYTLLKEVRERDSIINIQAKGLAEANVQLERLHMEERLDNVIGGISRQVFHDLKSPVTALKVISQNVVLENEKEAVLKSAINRIEAIISEIGKVTFRKKFMELKYIVPESIGSYLAYDLILPVFREKVVEYSKMNCAISFRVDPGAETSTIKCQSENFYRIISNLVNNAIEANSASVNIVLRKDVSQKNIVIEVLDTGRGMPNEMIAKVFGKGVSFNKLHSSGLGLYHAKQCMELWGGKISIESMVGKGTSVKLTFSE